MIQSSNQISKQVPEVCRNAKPNRQVIFFRHKKLLYLKAKQPIMSALTVQSISNQFRTVVGAGEGKRKLRLVLVSLLFE